MHILLAISRIILLLVMLGTLLLYPRSWQAIIAAIIVLVISL